VRWYRYDEGWGVLDASEGPGGIFVHFSVIEMEGFKCLRDGQAVEVDLEGPLAFEQDGYRYRATRVRPLE
jgi:CspA family cold shock protein